MNSEEGWQIFESRLIHGDSKQGRAGGKGGKRGVASQTKHPARELQQDSNGERGASALDTMKEERLDAIFRLLLDGSDGLVSESRGLLHLPSVDFEGCLKDREVALLVSDALSIYSSTSAATGYGEQITAGDFKRACFEHFKSTGLSSASSKSFSWKTILAYDRVSAFTLPGAAANRALQAYQQESSSQAAGVPGLALGLMQDRERPAHVPVLNLTQTSSSVRFCCVRSFVAVREENLG